MSAHKRARRKPLYFIEMDYYINGVEVLPAFSWENKMKRQEIILRALKGELNWIQVAEILGVTARHARRIHVRYEKGGPSGLLDSRRGPARNRICEETIEKVCQLYREQYFDFITKHFHEKLKAEHGITECYA